MKFNFLKVLSLVLAASFVMTSCDPEPEPIEQTLYEKEGVFIINEGSANGSLSFIDGAGTIHNDLFQAENDGAVIGKYVQSASFIDDKIFLVAGGSGKVEVVNNSDIKTAGTITGLANPRYMIEGDGDQAYVSQWGTTGTNGQVMVVNTKDYTVTDSINLGNGPEMMLLSDDKLYVANSGGYGADSTLVIVNATDNSTIKKVDVGGCPTQLLESNGTVWVMAAGCYDAAFIQGNGQIAKIENDIATHLYAFPYGPLDNLTESADGTKLYITSSLGVYSFDKATGFFSTTPLIEGSFYGMDLNKATNKLYLAKTDYVNPNEVLIYDMSGDTPNKISTVTAGLSTGEFYFQQ